MSELVVAVVKGAHLDIDGLTVVTASAVAALGEDDPLGQLFRSSAEAGDRRQAGEVLLRLAHQLDRLEEIGSDRDWPGRRPVPTSPAYGSERFREAWHRVDPLSLVMAGVTVSYEPDLAVHVLDRRGWESAGAVATIQDALIQAVQRSYREVIGEIDPRDWHELTPRDIRLPGTDYCPDCGELVNQFDSMRGQKGLGFGMGPASHEICCRLHPDKYGYEGVLARWRKAQQPLELAGFDDPLGLGRRDRDHEDSSVA